MFTVNTHGNRHRLTIVATDTRSAYLNTFRLDTGKAGKHEDEDWCDFMWHSDGAKAPMDWKLIAAMILKAYRGGHLQPRHVYRVPVWGLMPENYRQALFNEFHKY